MTWNYEPADIVIYIQGKGMVLKEKSLVAFYPETGKIEAFGTEAEDIASKNLEGISVVSPLRRGMIWKFCTQQKAENVSVGKLPLDFSS